MDGPEILRRPVRGTPSGRATLDLGQFRQQRFFGIADALAAKPEERAFAGCVGDRVGDCHDPGFVFSQLGHSFLVGQQLQGGTQSFDGGLPEFLRAASPADNGTMSRRPPGPM